RPSWAFEIAGGLLTGVAIAGDIGNCKGCSAPLPLGVHVALRSGYQLPSGIAFHLDAGFLQLSQRVRGRATQLLPVGKAPNDGLADDAIDTYGATVGLAVAYRAGSRFVTTLRLGAGTVLGATGDRRTGTFANSLGQPYGVDVRDTRPTTLF